MITESIKNFWNGLTSKTKKIIKTFVEAGIASALTLLSSNAIGLDKDGVKILIISVLSAGLSAVMNLSDRG